VQEVTSPGRTAVGYVRVSTEEQSQAGVSLDAQTERIRDYCRFNGYELRAIYRDEGVSGSVKLVDRPEGGQLLHLVACNQIGHVVALKLDRLFRDAVNCLQTASDWDQAGIALHLIDLGGQAVNTTSAMGRFFLTVMAGAAEMERNLGRERTSSALQHMKATGTRLGMPPLGFSKRTPEGQNDVLAAEMEAVALILRKRRRNRASFRVIATELNARNLPTKRGGTWHAATVRGIWLRREEYGPYIMNADVSAARVSCDTGIGRHAPPGQRGVGEQAHYAPSGESSAVIPNAPGGVA